MRLAYIIIAHTKPALLLRLVRRLLDERTTVLIHVDRRAARGVFERVAAGTRTLPRVHLLDRIPCRWGDFGHVRVTLTGIHELVERGVPFDYAVLLTGQDYPIKATEQIIDFFERNAGRSFMEHFELPSPEWTDGGTPRFVRWHVRPFGRHIALPTRRRMPLGFRPFGGSSYWCLTSDCVEYAEGFSRRNRRFVDFFKHVDIPDELIFQTMLMNSPLASTIANDDLRHIVWADGPTASPTVLRSHDFPTLAASPKLFARKFDMEIDAKVLDRIDREILGQDTERS